MVVFRSIFSVKVSASLVDSLSRLKNTRKHMEQVHYEKLVELAVTKDGRWALELENGLEVITDLQGFETGQRLYKHLYEYVVVHVEEIPNNVKWQVKGTKLVLGEVTEH